MTLVIVLRLWLKTFVNFVPDFHGYLCDVMLVFPFFLLIYLCHMHHGYYVHAFCCTNGSKDIHFLSFAFRMSVTDHSRVRTQNDCVAECMIHIL